MSYIMRRAVQLATENPLAVAALAIELDQDTVDDPNVGEYVNGAGSWDDDAAASYVTGIAVGYLTRRDEEQSGLVDALQKWLQGNDTGSQYETAAVLRTIGVIRRVEDGK